MNSELEDAILEKVDMENNLNKLIKELTDDELNLLIFLSQGYSYAETAKALGISRTRAYYLFQNIKAIAMRFR